MIYNSIIIGILTNLYNNMDQKGGGFTNIRRKNINLLIKGFKYINSN